jgi:hypothetical protein
VIDLKGATKSMKKKSSFPFVLSVKLISVFLSLLALACSSKSNQSLNKNCIQPCQQNPKYWQYKGQPVLLLGASDNDNLFQIGNLAEHLDSLKAAGGNYIRNTMSSRDSGDLWPFYMQADSSYDLDRWNQDYWQKFAQLLKLTDERDIIIQIEIWDRFDYSREPWQLNPFNPVNNINYSESECGLAAVYPNHPGIDLQPFFHTIQGMQKYDPKLEIIKKYQQRFVDKLLSYTLNFGNILYCMDNETSTPSQWGIFWIRYIKEKAKQEGKKIYTTDMFDNFFKPQSCIPCLYAIRNFELYTFLDISQINSRNFGQAHWDTLQWILNQRNQSPPRPVNNTKVYGGNYTSWGSGSNRDGIERFCRNIIGGCAAARHHRPPTGNGLNSLAKTCIYAIRTVEKLVNFWELEVAMHLLTEREDNEAYCTAREGEAYVIYFPGSGTINLDLTQYKSRFSCSWINVTTGRMEQTLALEGGGLQEITTPNSDGWFAVITISQ